MMHFVLPGNFSGSVNYDIKTIDVLSHVPGIQLVSHVEKADIQINCINTKEFLFEQNNTSVNMSLHYPSDILHILYALCRKMWITHHYYPVHSVLINNTLVVGHSNSGKTSIALHALCNHATVHSGDKTLLHFDDGKIQAQAGTSTLTIRSHDSTYWENKGFMLTQNNERSVVHLASCLPVEIHKIVLFNINDNVHDVKNIAYPSSLHTLFPLLFDWMRSDVVIGNGAALLDGTVPSESRLYAMQQLHQALQCIPVMHIQGTSQQICDTIIQL